MRVTFDNKWIKIAAPVFVKGKWVLKSRAAAGHKCDNLSSLHPVFVSFVCNRVSVIASPSLTSQIGGKIREKAAAALVPCVEWTTGTCVGQERLSLF